MREETTSSGYDQPRTDPIPSLGDEPEEQRAAHVRPGGQSQMQAAAPIPAQAGPVEQPLGGPEATEPPGPEAAPYDPEPDLEPAPTGHQDTAPVSEAPVGAPAASGSDRAGEDTGAVLFGGDEVERFRLRWRDLQADFVDDPARAVQGADQLVDEVLRALAEVFAAHKRELEDQWHAGGSGETEELRMALRGYRSFFDQLLKT